MAASRGDIMRWIALPGGPLLAALCYLSLPAQYTQTHTGQIVEFTAAGRMTLSIMAWMAAWWLTEAIHISATALRKDLDDSVIAIAAGLVLFLVPVDRSRRAAASCCPSPRRPTRSSMDPG